MSIDTSGLDAAKAQAQSSASAVATAYQQVTKAAEDQAAASARQMAAIAAYDKAAQKGESTQKALGAAFDKATAAGASFSDAMEKAVASVTLLNAAEETENRTLTTNYALRRTAIEEMQVLSGSAFGAARAIGDFASQLPGVGALMQGAFSGFVLVAFAELAYQAGKAVYEALDLGGERAKKLQQELAGVNNSWRSLIDTTNVEIDKLQEADAKLEKRINPNGLKLALDEALEDADKLSSKIDGLIDKQQNFVKGTSGSWLEQPLGIKGGTGYEQTMMSEHKRHLDEQVNIQGQLNESVSYYNSLMIRKDELDKRVADPGTSPAVVNNLREEGKAVQQMIEWQAKEQTSIERTIALQAEQENHEKIVQAHQGDKGEKQQAEVANEIAKAKIEAAHAGDAELPAAQRITAELEKHLELDLQELRYRNDLASLGGKPSGGTELRSAQDTTAIGNANAQVDALAHEAIQQAFEEEQRAQQTAYREDEAAQKRSAEQYKKSHEEKMRMLQAETEAKMKSATDTFQATQKNIEYQEKIGALMPKQAAPMLLAASHTEENQQVGALQAQQSQYNPALSEANVVKVQELQDKITAIQQKASLQRQQIVEQETIREVAVYQQAMQQVSSAIISATNTWMTTNKKFGDAMVDAGKKVAVGFIDDILKMGLKWAEHEAMMTLLHLLGITQRNAATAAGNAAAATAAAAAATAQKATNITMAVSYAGVASSAAAAEAAAAGPEAAAAAGAAMIAIMAPFVTMATMERGGIVGGRVGQPMPIMAHGQEAVLPQPLTSLLMNAATSGGSGAPQAGGHKFTSVFSPQITLLDSRGLEGFARRAGDAHGREMMRYARRMNATN